MISGNLQVRLEKFLYFEGKWEIQSGNFSVLRKRKKWKEMFTSRSFLRVKRKKNPVLAELSEIQYDSTEFP